MRKVTPDMVDRIRELREMGWNQHDIAKEVGVSQSSVERYLNPGIMEESKRRVGENYRKLKLDIIALFGGKCVNPDCGITDWRILTINHINGGGRKDREKYSGNGRGFFYAILDGRRPTDDLNLLCTNCQVLYEYKVGRRKVESQVCTLHVRAIERVGGKHPSCAKCGISDMRVLEINHLNGDNKEDRKKYGGHGLGLYYAIIDGRRPTDDLDIRCANCNILYAYECGIRGISEDPGRVVGSELSASLSQINHLRSTIKQ